MERSREAGLLWLLLPTASASKHTTHAQCTRRWTSGQTSGGRGEVSSGGREESSSRQSVALAAIAVVCWPLFFFSIRLSKIVCRQSNTLAAARGGRTERREQKKAEGRSERHTTDTAVATRVCYCDCCSVRFTLLPSTAALLWLSGCGCPRRARYAAAASFSPLLPHTMMHPPHSLPRATQHSSQAVQWESKTASHFVYGDESQRRRKVRAGASRQSHKAVG